MSVTSIIWFRHDLRLDDHPALLAAAQDAGAVIPLFIGPANDTPPAPGAASRWWLHHALCRLGEQLESIGSRLIIRQGEPLDVLRSVVQHSDASRVVWSRRYEPAVIARDKQIKSALKADGVEVASDNSHLLFEPWENETQKGDPYQVFTPFWKSCLSQDAPASPVDAPTSLPAPDAWPESIAVEEFNLMPSIDWASGFDERWTPGEAGAMQQLDEFLSSTAKFYKTSRDIPGERGTSRLSPHLHFGEISIRRVWEEASARRESTSSSTMKASLETFLKELGWREFAHHVLFHFPHTVDSPLSEKFEDFPWELNAEHLKAWQQGLTGYPIVDAGMRELWATGWMHNRVRMLVGSFLCKDLRISWQKGADWFWDTLVDADLANNTLGWQWIGGCGADAAPYFRVFNPMTQGKKFDAKGAYVRRWVPELADLPDGVIHQPWDADDDVLAAANVTLGETYPHPIVDHAAARKVALNAYEAIK